MTIHPIRQVLAAFVIAVFSYTLPAANAYTAFSKDQTADTVIKNTIQSLNHYRSNKGLPALTQNDELTKVAMHIASEYHKITFERATAALNNNEDPFTPKYVLQSIQHKDSQGRNFLERLLFFNIQVVPGMQEIVAGGTDLLTPEDAILAFERSPYHQPTLVNQTARSVAVGYYYDDFEYGFSHYWAIIVSP